MQDSRMIPFLEELERLDGEPPLSEAKILMLRNPHRTLVLEEGDRVVAVGVAAHHGHVDGTDHWSVETALEPGLRFPEFEGRLVQAALDLVPVGQPLSVWSHRTSLDAALVSAGFGVVRELAYMSIDLPMDDDGAQVGIRPLQPGDTRQLLAINRAAFSTHREAGSMDEKEFHELLAQAGMGASGVLILEEGTEMAGFCWTRVHANGDGEIFRIAVAPENQGAGLGRTLIRAGFDYLARQPNVSVGTLWVDTSHEKALRLYKDIGMAEIRFNREFEVPTPRK